MAHIYKSRFQKTFFILFMLSFSVSCGDSDLDDDQWRAITNNSEILAGIKFNSPTGELTIVNNSSSTIGAPALTTYDLSTGTPMSIAVSGAAEIASGETAKNEVTFPGDSGPDDSALITLSLGGEEAAVFMTSEIYSTLSPAITAPSLIPSLTPNPGNWYFEMQLGTEYLTGSHCPTEPGESTSSGGAKFYTSSNGLSANLYIDSALVFFSRSSADGPFRSPTYNFPVRTEDDSVVYGTNKWTLSVSSVTSITGFLEWDNSLGCSANYPIEMDFISLADPSIHALCEGMWSITFGPIVCGGVPIDPSPLGGLPAPLSNLDVTYAYDTPSSLTIGTMTGFLALPYIGGNTYGLGVPNVLLGIATDSSGFPLSVVGGFQMFALSPTFITGVMTIHGNGANPCLGSATFTMTSLSGC